MRNAILATLALLLLGCSNGVESVVIEYGQVDPGRDGEYWRGTITVLRETASIKQVSILQHELMHALGTLGRLHRKKTCISNWTAPRALCSSDIEYMRVSTPPQVVELVVRDAGLLGDVREAALFWNAAVGTEMFRVFYEGAP